VRRRTELGWRAAVLDERGSRHVFVCERGTQRLTSASLSERQRAMDMEGAEASFLCLIAGCRSLRIALGSRRLCRRSPTKSVSSRSSAARRRAIRCEQRRRRRIPRAMREQLPQKGWINRCGSGTAR
jgi:hypothetical protein